MTKNEIKEAQDLLKSELKKYDVEANRDDKQKKRLEIKRKIIVKDFLKDF